MVPLRCIALAVAACFFAACASSPVNQVAVSSSAEGFGSVAGSTDADLPKHELTREMLYEFLLAEIAGQRGNLALSAQAYADLAKRTRDPRLAERATEIALYARMPEAAVESAKVWADVSPGSAKALGTASSLLVRANRPDEAEPYLQKILSAPSTNRNDGFLQLNALLAANPDKAANLRMVERLAQPYPELAQARFAIAQAAQAAGDEELALREARAAGRLAPDWELGVLYEASLLQKTSNSAAAERLGEYLKGHPKSRDVRVAYARTLVADKNFPAARGEFEQLLKDHPDNTEVVLAVAILSMQLEDWANADANLKRLLQLEYRDRNTVRLYLGQVAEERKEFRDALKWYGEVTHGEQLIPAQIRTAQVISKQGDLPRARKFLHQVNATTQQQRVQLILAETQLLRDANQPNEAFSVVEHGLAKMPNEPDLLYDHAMLGEKLDRLDILEGSLRKLIELKPDHAHAYNALGYTLADRNQRLDEAKELIERALKLAPDDATIIDSLGWVLYRQGKPEEALKHLRRAYSDRHDPEIGAHLGEVLWTLGRRAEAQKVWDEALAKSPGNEVLIKTVERLKK
jgi:tetratricopeptide (TPR) repeat protein